jgi:hypothetical protein
MIYRYNVSVNISGTIDTVCQLSNEQLELAVESVLGIPRHRHNGVTIHFEGDVTDWGNAKYGPNYIPSILVPKDTK